MQSREDFIRKYKETVDSITSFRILVMLPIAIILHLVFSIMDFHVYPAQALFFLKIRIFDSVLASIACALLLFKPCRKFSVWVASFCATLLCGAIIFMIYLTDGASSNYYAGVNLTLLALLIVNAFNLRHSFFTCLVVVALYVAAALGNQAGWDFMKFCFATYFMGSTAFFVVLITKFYRDQHFNAFMRNEELKENERKLGVLYGMAEEKSKIDDLTKIYNRAYFFEILSAKIDVCKRTDSFFYLTIFDIDHFKHINDTYGHLFGDQVIAAVARTVQRVIRMDSYLGRFGGDEFMIIIDKATQEEFLSRLKKVRLAIQQMELLYEGKPVSISASFGAVRLDPVMMDEKKLIGLADDALLEVKRSRRGEIKLANESGL